MFLQAVEGMNGHSPSGSRVWGWHRHRWGLAARLAPSRAEPCPGVCVGAPTRGALPELPEAGVDLPGVSDLLLWLCLNEVSRGLCCSPFPLRALSPKRIASTSGRLPLTPFSPKCRCLALDSIWRPQRAPSSSFPLLPCQKVSSGSTQWGK